MLPLLAGERSPGWAGDATGSIAGLHLSTTPLDILRASLEGVAYRFALIAQGICTETDCSHRFIASGGGLLNSPAWLQIFADVLGRPVVASAEPEATSRGAALLALEALKAVPSVEAVPSEDGRVYEAEFRASAALSRRHCSPAAPL